ncbi:MAG: hypothetical protein ACR2PL_05280 [Dehalococcoidia bacterium]
MTPTFFDTSFQEKLLQGFTQVFDGTCKALNVPVMTTAIDKHGSYVWEAGSTDILNRYIALSATPVLEPRPEYLCEITVGADDNERFVHRNTWQLGVSPAGDLKSVYEKIRHALEHSWRSAAAIQSRDLEESYIVPRLSPRWYEGYFER